MLLQLSHFSPFIPLHPAHPFPPAFPLFSSCTWVLHITSLAATFPILFLPSPCLSSTYYVCYSFSVPFPPLSPPTPLLITLHVISISVILSCARCLLSLCLFLFQVWLLITVAILLLQVLSFIQKYSKIFYDCFGVKMHIISYPKSLFFPLWP